MVATSAMIIAPKREKIPATTHTNSNTTGEPNCEAIRAGFMKILDPITLPATMETAVQSPILR
jgi:hypothetical protein